MIKINHLNKKSMDLVMELSRQFNDTPEAIIKSILNYTNYEDAERAIYECKNSKIKGGKEGCKS